MSSRMPANPPSTATLRWRPDPIVTRVVRARVTDAGLAEDLVQETLVRVLARANRVAPGMLEPYAIVTARNVVAS